jgi:hypothetical protein
MFIGSLAVAAAMWVVVATRGRLGVPAAHRSAAALV